VWQVAPQTISSTSIWAVSKALIVRRPSCLQGLLELPACCVLRSPQGQSTSSPSTCQAWGNCGVAANSRAHIGWSKCVDCARLCAGMSSVRVYRYLNATPQGTLVTFSQVGGSLLRVARESGICFEHIVGRHSSMVFTFSFKDDVYTVQIMVHKIQS
jgi:hypothetical protein